MALNLQDAGAASLAPSSLPSVSAVPSSAAGMAATRPGAFVGGLQALRGNSSASEEVMMLGEAPPFELMAADSESSRPVWVRSFARL